MVCAICKVRRPRRYCPGVGGDICTICCGTEREVTVTCPLDCVYLNDARLHHPVAPPDALPNTDIRITEEMVEKQEQLLSALASSLLQAALKVPGIVDNDVQQALDALVQTYRTLQSGIYFESLPQNPLAASVYQAVQQGAQQFREAERQQLGISRTRDADMLAMLVFLQQYAYSVNNGRPRGRSFIHALLGSYPPFAGEEAPPPASSIILP